ncbi:MAG: hypothetical protein AB7U45_10655 [Desulfamplus sp.]
MKNDTSLMYLDNYVIYLDRLGTSSFIQEKDSVYGNRIGFYKMNELYLESYEIFKSVFKNNFNYFGFSDTIIAVPKEKNARDVAVAASSVFVELLKLDIATKIYITRGDFYFHRFESLNDKQDNFICPIYGSTILDSHKMDASGIKCLGVFVHSNALEDFIILKNVKFVDGLSSGLLDLHYYLCEKSKTNLSSILNNLLIMDDENKALEILEIKEHGFIKSMVELLKEHHVSEKEIVKIITENSLRRNRNKKALLDYCKILQKALSGCDIALERNKE